MSKFKSFPSTVLERLQGHDAYEIQGAKEVENHLAWSNHMRRPFSARMQ